MWKEFTFKRNYRELNNTIEVKLGNGKVVSIWNIVGGNALDKNGEEIDLSSVLFFRPKKDLEQYKKLQKYFELLQKYDEETLDELSFAISSSLDISYNSLEDEKLSKLFKKLNKYIKKSQEKILIESKTYL